MVLKTIAPRLLDRESTAAYLAVSVWTVRDLEADGILHPVRMPAPSGGKLRHLQKTLYDRLELDSLVESWREGVAGGSRGGAPCLCAESLSHGTASPMP